MFPASNYLDPGYQQIKTSIKEIIDQNQSVSKASMSKLFVPIQLITSILAKTTASSANLSLSAEISGSQFLDTTQCTSVVFQKTMTDLLAMWWESYFSKNMVCIWSN